jgi:DNA-binding LacI/PurR family transcriptional regulator
VHQPSIEFGATMARVLVARLEGLEVERATVLATALVVRQST